MVIPDLMKSWDILIIGGGIAGASLAWRLACDPAYEPAGGPASTKGKRSIALLEAEDHPGRHATGRSAAFFSETYGNETIRALTTASRGFYETPPEDFSQAPLLEPCGALFLAREDQLASLESHYQSTKALAPSIEKHGPEFALSRVPILRPEAVAACVFEPESRAINVGGLLQGYLAGARRSGVDILTRRRVSGLTQQAGSWQVSAGAETFEAEIIVNAGGAWAGELGLEAGALDIGLTPMRRSVCVLDPQKLGGMKGDCARWPLVLDVDQGFYFKPDGAMIWLSPSEEDPSPPCDAAPDELVLAKAIDRFEQATSVTVRRIEHKWAGLRSFVADRTPVVGFDPLRPGFFWLAGQGGYGIQTSPAVSDIAAALITGQPVPQACVTTGVSLQALDPGRLKTG